MRYLIILIAILSSCSNESEQKMELSYLKEISAEKLNHNYALLKRMEKEVADEGMHTSDTAIVNVAQRLIEQRNKHLNSGKKLIEWSKKIEAQYRKIFEVDTSKLAYSRFYTKRLEQGFDSLTYIKLLNSYLSLEEDILEDHLRSIARCCRFFNGNAHVIKTGDTISINDTYEFIVVPDYFDHNRARIDSCKLIVYKNGNEVTTGTEILKKGNALIISVLPKERGNYRATGYFIQKDRFSDIRVHQKFSVEFFVRNGCHK